MPEPDPDHPETLLAWRTHPAREHPGRAALGAAVIAALAGLGWLAAGGIWGAGVAVTVLVLALNRFWLPSRFAIDDAGIVARFPLGTRRLAWSDARGFVHDREGGLITTRAIPGRFDPRAIAIVFGGENRRERVVALVEERLARAAIEGGGAWAP